MKAIWNKNYNRCVECGNTDRKHKAHGICQRCYDRERGRKRRLTDKECIKTNWKKHYDNNKEKIVERNKKYRKTEKHKQYLKARKYKRKAIDAANNAEKFGKIKKQPCEVCDSPDVHKHHDDYSKPLEVRWFCRRHHEELHHGVKTIVIEGKVTMTDERRSYDDSACHRTISIKNNDKQMMYLDDLRGKQVIVLIQGERE